MNEENTQEVQQQEQPQQEAQQTTTQEVAEKPSYLGDEYWENGQVNLEKMSKDLAETKKREKGLREKLSKSKEVEPFESVFEDRQYSDSQRKELNRFVEIARKSGLNKQQTESVLDAVAAWSEENNKARFEENEKPSWDDVYYMTNRAYDLISRGHSDEGNQLLDKAHKLNASLS